MPLLLLILFIGIPLGELALLLWIADQTDWTYSVAIVIVTGVLGVVLMRLHGVLTLRRLKRSFSGGESPTDPLIDTAFLLFAGGLLLTPGVITDLLGLSLIFPPTRAAWRHFLKSRVRGRFQFFSWTSMGPFGDQDGQNPTRPYQQQPLEGDGNVIEGEVVDRSHDERSDPEL